jgi:hypothetical protein
VKSPNPRTRRSQKSETIVKNLNLIKKKLFLKHTKRVNPNAFFAVIWDTRKLSVILNRRPARAKFKTATHENNVIDIDDFSDEFECLDELPEIQEFMEDMDMEVSKKDLPNPKVKQDTNTLFTTGVILEISVALIISSESDVKSILLSKVLIDTGCTRTIVKRNKLPDKFFESRKQLNEVSWTTNAGNFAIFLYSFHYQNSPQVAKLTGMTMAISLDDIL